MNENSEYTIEQLQFIFDTYDRVVYKSPLYYFLVNNTTFLTGRVFPKQRLWHIIHNITDIPKCKNCNNKVKWDDAQPFVNQQYRKFCCGTCGRVHKDTRAKKIATELDRYGVGRSSIVEKTKQTNLKKYGFEFAIQTDKYKQKKIDTTMARYGVENVSKIKSLMDKREDTNLIKYGVKHAAQQHLPVDVVNKLNDRDWLYDQHIDQKCSIIDIATSLDINYEIITRHLQRYDIPITRYPSSLGEKELFDYVDSICSVDILSNVNNLIPPYQLDIYIPSHKLAIEYNGVYWHSELRGRDKNYHLNKTTKCEELGIRLIHVLESEWIKHPDIVKSRLSTLLGKCKTIPARKTKVAVISAKDTRAFLNNTHSQGCGVSGVVNLGLIYEGELVAIMTFGKSRFNKNYEYELLRFSSRLMHNVVGGAGKLFSHFIKSYRPISIISYADKRWSNGNLYKQLGFNYLHTSKPNYFYFTNRDPYTLLSRTAFQKHKLKDKLAVFDPSLSEWRNMVNNGYNRIWDCGNSVWTYPT